MATKSYDEKMVKKLADIRRDSPNDFYTQVKAYARDSGRTEDEIVAIFNAWCDEEYAGLEED